MLWARMRGMYGALWTSAMGEQPFRRDVEPKRLTVTGSTWVKGLASVSNDAIAGAMDALEASGAKMPPTFPEFLALCYPLPSVDEVHNYICGRGELHPFMLMVARRMNAKGRGTFHYRQADARTAERMLRNAYEACRADVIRGVPLPELPKQMEHKKEPRKYAPPEVVEAAKQTIEAHLAAARAAAEAAANPDDTTGAKPDGTN